MDSEEPLLRKVSFRKPSKVVPQVPRYKIDLDLPHEERWNQIVDDYAEQWREVEEWVKETAQDGLGKKLGPFVQTMASSVMSWINSLGVVYYAKELSGIAKRAKMDLGVLVILQLMYEASTCCTSIVVEDADGIPHHIRTMDWQLELLEPLTVELEFQKGGKTVYIATSWAGYVGVLTGVRCGEYSVSINYRATKDGSFWTNIKNAVSSCWPIGFLVREVLESCSDWNSALPTLSESPLIAPCYMTMAGTKKGQGALITRNVKDDVKRWYLSEKGTIVQPNVDHFMNEDDEDSFDIMNSYKRREYVRRSLKKISPEKISDETLWTLMSFPPVFNSITVYGTYMHPKKGILETRVPEPKTGFIPINISKEKMKDYIIYTPSTDHSDSAQRTQNPETKKCRKCGAMFNIHLNKKGACTAHTKTWHSTFSDCNYLKCGFGLGATNLGVQHWGCCYITNKKITVCSKPKDHVSEDEEEQDE